MEDVARLAEAVRGGGREGRGGGGAGRGGSGRAAGMGDVPEPWEHPDCVRKVANVSEKLTRAERICGKE